MNHLEDELSAAVSAWDARGWPRPGAAIVSGSGLAVDLGSADDPRLPLTDLLERPLEGIVGHPLEVQLLRPRADLAVVYFRGRLHGYQGHTAAEVVFQARLAALLGAKALLLSNAAGGLQTSYSAGQLVLVRDHLNLTSWSPLFGHPPSSWGPRFPDMTEAYDRRLRELLQEHAEPTGGRLAEGVYAGLAGPSYETPAEVQMLRALGADLVGMSTVLEVIAARHMGVRCACLSLVSNLGAGLTDAILVHEEVLEASQQAAGRLRDLLLRLLSDPRFPTAPAG